MNPHKVPIGKRSMDLVIGSLCLILAAPLILVIALCVRVTMGSPILFRQVRPGLGGELFVLFKFRSMRIGDGDDESRLSELGAFLRRTSLDELPELWNVLKGEMSLVAPRPLLEQYLGRYWSEQERHHDVLPGMTGWAQVKGRNNVDWEQRFAMDL